MINAPVSLEFDKVMINREKARVASIHTREKGRAWLFSKDYFKDFARAFYHRMRSGMGILNSEREYFKQRWDEICNQSLHDDHVDALKYYSLLGVDLAAEGQIDRTVRGFNELRASHMVVDDIKEEVSTSMVKNLSKWYGKAVFDRATFFYKGKSNGKLRL